VILLKIIFFWNGINNSLEPETIWIWKKICKNSNYIIDIGANTGVYSLISYALNNNAKVVAFEPAEKTFLKLVKNIKLNNFNIKAEKIALSNTEGHLLFYDTIDGDQTMASLSSRMLKDVENKNYIINEYEVLVNSLDKYFKNNKLLNVDLIKIDVELHEPEVLEGMVKTMELYRPIIFIEILLPDIADRCNKYFEGKKYRFFEIIKGQIQYYLKEINMLEGRNNFNWNFICCPEEKYNAIVQYVNYSH
jgi:FkbM family methyltransferase